MALTLTITDGTTSVSLVAAAGLAAADWTPAEAELVVQELTTGLADGADVRSASRLPVTETVTIRLKGTSHDNIASQYQTLIGLLEEARQYHTTDWQVTPVYLQAQTSTETSPRYSLLLWGTAQPGSSWIEPIFRNNSFWRDVTITLRREPWYRSAVPCSLPTAASISQPQIASTGTERFIPNCRETALLTHVYTYDDSAGTWSANLIAAAVPFDLFPNPAGAADILYVGSTSGVFRDVIYNLGTLAVGYTIVVEYWAGAWSSVVGEDGPNDFAGDGTNLGRYVSQLHLMTGWASGNLQTIFGGTAPNVAGYWVRYRITGGALTTMPQQKTDAIYNAADPRISWASTVVTGDYPALTRLLVNAKSPSSAVNTGIFGVIAGLKTRGLTNFTSHLNWAAANPAGWSLSDGSDTTHATADITAPGGTRAVCTFAGTVGLAQRIRLTNSTAATVSDWAGSYRVFLRCQQIGGAAGGAAVQLYAIVNGATVATNTAQWVSELVALQGVADFEVVDLGVMTLPPIARGRGLVASQLLLINQLDFALFAKDTTGADSCDLYLYDLVLIPADEMVVAAECQSTAGDDDQSIQQQHALIIDGGVTGTGAQLLSNWLLVNKPGLSWHLLTPPPALPPDRAGALFFLFLLQGVAPYKSDCSHGAMISLYLHRLWAQLAGAE